MKLSKRAKHAAAVWAVLKRKQWLTASQITDRAHEYIPKCRDWMTTATATARLRDFRQPEYGRHKIKRQDRRAGFDAPAYKLIR